MTDKLPDPSRDQWMANKVSSSVAHVNTFETHYGCHLIMVTFVDMPTSSYSFHSRKIGPQPPKGVPVRVAGDDRIAIVFEVS